MDVTGKNTVTPFNCIYMKDAFNNSSTLKLIDAQWTKRSGKNPQVIKL